MQRCALLACLWLCVVPVPSAVANEGFSELREFQLQALSERYGEAARERIAAWQRLLQRLRRASNAEKLQAVNRFFNRIKFVSDQKHWNQQDYWATPMELLASNGGDCEDFAIAKYYTLKRLGLPLKRMRLTYVKSLSLNQEHMVLTYYEKPGATPLVLDNLTNHIKLADQRPDLQPVYSFDGSDLWQADQHLGNSDQIGPWQDLQQRLMLQFKQ